MEVGVAGHHEPVEHEAVEHRLQLDVEVQLPADLALHAGQESRELEELAGRGEAFDTLDPHPLFALVIRDGLALDVDRDHRITDRVVLPEAVDRADDLAHDLARQSLAGVALDLGPPGCGRVLLDPFLEAVVHEVLDAVEHLESLLRVDVLVAAPGEVRDADLRRNAQTFSRQGDIAEEGDWRNRLGQADGLVGAVASRIVRVHWVFPFPRW